MELPIIMRFRDEASRQIQGVGREFQGMEQSASRAGLQTAALEQRSSLLAQEMNRLGKEVAQGKISVDQADTEYKKFESTLAKVETQAEDTQGVFGRMRSGLSQAGQAWTQIATPIESTIALLGRAKQAAEQAYQYIGEGAQMSLAQGQFDALTGSIGTTSDAMIGDLRAATRGTVSDFKLMEGASQLLNLGLTKTSEETVRLGTVAGKLNWDMNVLGLTIANQSTARLDSLGLSMEDVKARAERLRAQGMATDEAFKFAIIEAGEAKLKLLGDAADTTAGKLKTLEANADNLSESFKAAFSETLITDVNDMAGGLFETADGASSLGDRLGYLAASTLTVGTSFTTTRASIIGFRESLKEIEGFSNAGVPQQMSKGFYESRDAIIANQEAMDGWMATANQVDHSAEVLSATMNATAYDTRAAANYFGLAADEITPLGTELFKTELVLRKFGVGVNQDTRELEDMYYATPPVTTATQALGESVTVATGAIYASNEAVAAYNRNLGQLYLQAQDTEASERLLNSGLQQTGSTMRWVSTLSGQQSADLERMQAAYDKAANTIRDYELGVKGANLTDEERNNKIAEQQQIMATLSANMQPLIDAGGQWVEVAGQMVSFGPAVADAFTESASAMGANAEQIAAIQMAFGDLQPAQAESILKEAALRAEVQRLTQEIVSGNMSVYEARDAYIAFQNGLNDANLMVNEATGSATLLRGEITGVTQDTDDMIAKFGEVPDEIDTEVILVNDAALSATEAYLMKLREIPDRVVTQLETQGGDAGASGATNYGGGGYQEGFSRGGRVRGGIPGRDSVPALLMPDEEVLTVDEAKRYRQMKQSGGLSSASLSQPFVNSGASDSGFRSGSNDTSIHMPINVTVPIAAAADRATAQKLGEAVAKEVQNQLNRLGISSANRARLNL